MNDAQLSIPDGWHSLSQLQLPFLAAHQQLLELTAPELISVTEKQQPTLRLLEVEYKNNTPVHARFDQSDECTLEPDSDFVEKFKNKVLEVQTANPPIIIAAGLGTFFEYQAIQRAVQSMPQTVVLVLDQNPLPIAINLCVYDMRPLVLSGAWVWAIGEPIIEVIFERVKAHSLFMAFTNNIDILFGSNAQDQIAAQGYVQAFQRCVEKLSKHCKSLNQASQVFQSTLEQQPKTISTVWSSGSISEYTSTPILRALHRALSYAGVTSRFTELPRGRTRKYVEYEGFVRAQPDLIFSVNDPSHSVVPQGKFHRAVWVTDDPTMRKNLDAHPTYDQDELVFFADPAYEGELKKQGVSRSAHLPVFALLDHEGNEVSEYRFPITFVGMIWNFKPFLEALSTRDRDVLLEAHQFALDSGSGTIGLRAWWSQREISQTLVQSAQRYFEVSGRSFHENAGALTYLTYMLDIDSRRRQMAEALLPLGLHVFGNRDWLSILGDQYAGRYHGFVPYDRLGDVYRSANIVIGIHSLQLPGSINIRDCDVLRAGGCLLTDPVSGMTEDAILSGRDCVTATTPQEFADAAQELLTNHEKRNQIRVQGQKTIEAAFLPQHRANLILSALQS